MLDPEFGGVAGAVLVLEPAEVPAPETPGFWVVEPG